MAATKQSAPSLGTYFKGYTFHWYDLNVVASPRWRHQMETFSTLLAICAGNSPGPVNSPHKGQWRGALMFSLIFAWINGWVNNGEAGGLRRHRTHCDVTVISNHQLFDCLSNCLFRITSQEHQRSTSLALCEENHSVPLDSPHKGLTLKKALHAITSSCLDEDVGDIRISLS